uniref:Zgc:113149 n=1 Tax=Paramormyrops kingsleyae TaxID=1676925 RepID=A0A3B3RVD3_9TELE
MSGFYYNPAGRGGNAMRFRKRKSRFTFAEVQLLLNEVKNNRHIVIGKFNRGVSSDVKKRTWAAITARINEISECPREVIEIIKKWSDLKCDTKRKVAAMRAGGDGSLRTGNSRIARDLSPVENMVYQILQMPPPDKRVFPGGRANLGGMKGVMGSGGGEDDEEEDDIVLGMHQPSASTSDSPNSRLAGPSVIPNSLGLTVSMALPASMPMSMPMSQKREASMSAPIYVTSRDPPQTAYDFQYEIPAAEDQVVELDNSDEEHQERVRPAVFRATPIPVEDEHLLSSLRHATTVASTSSSLSATAAPCSGPGPVLAPVPPPPAESFPVSSPAPMNARDRLAQHASLSVQEQRNTNILMETVSRSLEMLSESVQQLVETQQEFVRDSLRLQRETVYILRDFSTSILAVMRDKLNEAGAHRP